MSETEVVGVVNGWLLVPRDYFTGKVETKVINSRLPVFPNQGLHGTSRLGWFGRFPLEEERLGLKKVTELTFTTIWLVLGKGEG